MPAPKDKFGSTSSSTGVLNQADADRLAAAAKGIVAANTKSPDAARKWLMDLGIVDQSGKLTKPYR